MDWKSINQSIKRSIISMRGKLTDNQFSLTGIGYRTKKKITQKPKTKPMGSSESMKAVK